MPSGCRISTGTSTVSVTFFGAVLFVVCHRGCISIRPINIHAACNPPASAPSTCTQHLHPAPAPSIHPPQEQVAGDVGRSQHRHDGGWSPDSSDRWGQCMHQRRFRHQDQGTNHRISHSLSSRSRMSTPPWTHSLGMYHHLRCLHREQEHPQGSRAPAQPRELLHI